MISSCSSFSQAIKQSIESTPITSFPLSNTSEDISDVKDSTNSTTSTCSDLPPRKNNNTERSGKYNDDGLNNMESNSKVSSTSASTSTSTSTLSVPTPLYNGLGKNIKEDTTRGNTTKYDEKDETAVHELKSVKNISLGNINNNIQDLQHNNFSDCESDAGVSVIAWDEMIRYDDKVGNKIEIENDDIDDVVTTYFEPMGRNIDSSKHVKNENLSAEKVEYFPGKDSSSRSERSNKDFISQGKDHEVINVNNYNHNIEKCIDNISATDLIHGSGTTDLIHEKSSLPSSLFPSSIISSSSSFNTAPLKSSTMDSTYHPMNIISPTDSKHSSFQFNSDFKPKVIKNHDDNNGNNHDDFNKNNNNNENSYYYDNDIDLKKSKDPNIDSAKSNYLTKTVTGISSTESNNERILNSSLLNTVKRDNADITHLQTLPHKRSSPNKLPRPHNMKFGEMSSFNYSTSSLASDGLEDTVETEVEQELMFEIDYFHENDFLCNNQIDNEVKEEEKGGLKMVTEKANHTDIHKSENQIGEIDSEQLLFQIDLALNKNVGSPSRSSSKLGSGGFICCGPTDQGDPESGTSLGSFQRPKSILTTQSDVMSEHTSGEELKGVQNIVENVVVERQDVERQVVIDANIDTLLFLVNAEVNLSETPLNCASYESTVYSECYGSYEVEEDDKEKEEYEYSEEEEEEENEGEGKEEKEEIVVVLNKETNIKVDFDNDLELKKSIKEDVKENIILNVIVGTMDSSNDNNNDKNNNDDNNHDNGLLKHNDKNDEKVVNEMTDQQDAQLHEINTGIKENEREYSGELDIAQAAIATEIDIEDDDDNEDDKTMNSLDEETKEGEGEVEVIMVIDVKECSESEEEASSYLSDNVARTSNLLI